jgi:hypothetical protein
MGIESRTLPSNRHKNKSFSAAALRQKTVTRSPHGLYVQRFSRIIFNFFPKAIDVHGNGFYFAV